MNGVVLLRRTCVILLGIALIAAAPANAAPDCSPKPAARVIASDQGVLESIATDKRGRIFFTDTNASRLLRIDRRGEQPVVLKEGIDGILAVMVDRDNSLVLGFGNNNTDALADNGNAGLMRVDPDTGETIEIITLGLDMSNGITRGRDGAYYASNDFGNGIDRFFGGQVTDNWSTVETPNGLVIDSTGRYLYAAQTFQPASIAQIDLATGTSTTYAEAGAADTAAGPDGMTRDRIQPALRRRERRRRSVARQSRPHDLCAGARLSDRQLGQLRRREPRVPEPQPVRRHLHRLGRRAGERRSL